MQKIFLVACGAAAACAATPLTLANGAPAAVLVLDVCYSWGHGGDDYTTGYFRRPDGRLAFASLRNSGDGAPDPACDVIARFDQGVARAARSGQLLCSFQKNAGSDTFDQVARTLYLVLRDQQDQLLAERARSDKPAAAAAAAPAPARASHSGSVLAVLELRNKLLPSERALFDTGYFSDQVRAAALKSVPGLRVITRENLLVLLEASGKRLEDCEGECEVDTGRRVGADLVISGEVFKIGSNYKLNLKIHDARSGRLVDGEVAAGKTMEDLDAATAQAVIALMSAP